MNRADIEREAEQDRQQLEPVFLELLSGVSRPDSLSAAALMEKLEKAPRPSRLRWVRPLAAAAAVLAVCLGALLAFWRQGFSSSITAAGENGTAAPQDVPSLAMAAAGDAAGGAEMAALEDAADGAEDVEAAPQMLEEAVLGKRARPEEALSAFYAPGILQTQVQGALEGKNVAQDEDYLYYLAPPSMEEAPALYIVKAEDMQTAAKVEMQADVQAQAVLVFEDRLALISDEAETAETGEAVFHVRADIYDVKDRSSPKLWRTIRQDGQLAASALQEGGLCLVSTCPAEQEILTAFAAPHVQDSLTGGDGVLSEEALLRPEGAEHPSWTVFTLLDLSKEAVPASLAVFGGTDSLLLGEGCAYLAVSCSGEEESSTVLSLSLEGGIPRQTAISILEGSLLLPQALIPLRDGLLAAVQKEGENILYRLDASLSQVQKLQP